MTLQLCQTSWLLNARESYESKTFQSKVHNTIISGSLRTVKGRGFLLSNKAHCLLKFRNIWFFTSLQKDFLACLTFLAVCGKSLLTRFPHYLNWLGTSSVLSPADELFPVLENKWKRLSRSWVPTLFPLGFVVVLVCTDRAVFPQRHYLFRLKIRLCFINFSNSCVWCLSIFQVRIFSNFSRSSLWIWEPHRRDMDCVSNQSPLFYAWRSSSSENIDSYSPKTQVFSFLRPKITLNFSAEKNVTSQ